MGVIGAKGHHGHWAILEGDCGVLAERPLNLLPSFTFISLAMFFVQLVASVSGVRFVIVHLGDFMLDNC